MCVLGLVDIIEYCGHVCVGVGGYYCVLGLVDIIEHCGHVCVGVGGHY